jgi:hypothetical protein
MPKFVFIPDRTLDVRNCTTRRWGTGVDLQVSIGGLRPVSIVRDGADGAFMLTTEFNANKTQEIALRLHHVNAAGVASAPITIANWSNVWFYDATLVAARAGSCIAVFTAAGWGNTLLAQRFDASLNPMWANPVALTTNNHGVTFVSAASDRNGGAIVAFKDMASDVGATQSFRVQRVLENGSLPWGTSGVSLVNPGTSPQMAFATPQVAVGPTDIAVVWEGWFLSGPAAVFGAWLDFNGQLLNGPFSIGTTLEIPGLSHRWVAADPNAGGFYVVLLPPPTPPSNLAKLRLLRFDAQSVTSAWFKETARPADRNAFALAEDGSGGALLATLGDNGLVSLARFNAQGTNVWGSAAAANVATVTLLNNPSLTGPNMAGSIAVGAKNTGGAILVFSNWQQPATPKLRQQCFDTAGAFFSASSDVAGAGSQDLPLLADMVLPTIPSPPFPRPFGGKFRVFDPEEASLIGMWRGASGASGASITAQKLGCCKTHYNGTIVTVPEFACGVPIDWPASLPGTINAIFPCGSPKGTFGLLPVPRLSLVPGANVPGGLVTSSVPSPDWVRIWFNDVPPDITIELRTHTNKVVAAAQALDAPTVTPVLGRIQTVTFKPSAKLSYILVFNRPHAEGNPAAVPLGLRVEFGSGDASPIVLPRTGPRARERAVTRGARKRASKKR